MPFLCWSSRRCDFGMQIQSPSHISDSPKKKGKSKRETYGWDKKGHVAFTFSKNHRPIQSSLTGDSVRHWEEEMLGRDSGTNDTLPFHHWDCPTLQDLPRPWRDPERKAATGTNRHSGTVQTSESFSRRVNRGAMPMSDIQADCLSLATIQFFRAAS